MATVPCEVFNIKMRPPGLSLAATVEHLELFAAEVMPHFRATRNSGDPARGAST